MTSQEKDFIQLAGDVAGQQRSHSGKRWSHLAIYQTGL